MPNVSVPLPGFSGLRPMFMVEAVTDFLSFSPVAGIQWVETLELVQYPPIAIWFQSRCRDSVG